MKTRRPRTQKNNFSLLRPHRPPIEEQAIEAREKFYFLVNKSRQSHLSIISQLKQVFHEATPSAPKLPDDAWVGVEALPFGQARLIDKEGYEIANSQDILPPRKTPTEKIYQSSFDFNQPKSKSKQSKPDSQTHNKIDPYQNLKAMDNNDFNVANIQPDEKRITIKLTSSTTNIYSQLKFYQLETSHFTNGRKKPTKWTDFTSVQKTPPDSAQKPVKPRDSVSHCQTAFSPLFFTTETILAIGSKQELGRKNLNHAIAELELDFINNILKI